MLLHGFFGFHPSAGGSPEHLCICEGPTSVKTTIHKGDPIDVDHLFSKEDGCRQVGIMPLEIHHPPMHVPDIFKNLNWSFVKGTAEQEEHSDPTNLQMSLTIQQSMAKNGTSASCDAGCTCRHQCVVHGLSDYM